VPVQSSTSADPRLLSLLHASFDGVILVPARLSCRRSHFSSRVRGMPCHPHKQVVRMSPTAASDPCLSEDGRNVCYARRTVRPFRLCPSSSARVSSGARKGCEGGPDTETGCVRPTNLRRTLPLLPRSEYHLMHRLLFCVCCAALVSVQADERKASEVGWRCATCARRAWERLALAAHRAPLARLAAPEPCLSTTTSSAAAASPFATQPQLRPQTHA
jgi:hypothetical protein